MIKANFKAEASALYEEIEKNYLQGKTLGQLLAEKIQFFVHSPAGIEIINRIDQEWHKDTKREIFSCYVSALLKEWQLPPIKIIENQNLPLAAICMDYNYSPIHCYYSNIEQLHGITIIGSIIHEATHLVQRFIRKDMDYFIDVLEGASANQAVVESLMLEVGIIEYNGSQGYVDPLKNEAAYRMQPVEQQAEFARWYAQFLVLQKKPLNLSVGWVNGQKLDTACQAALEELTAPLQLNYDLEPLELIVKRDNAIENSQSPVNHGALAGGP